MNHVYSDMYDALREAGATEQKARATVADLPEPQHLSSVEPRYVVPTSLSICLPFRCRDL